jgi:DNA polymerase-3 subunit beta
MIRQTIFATSHDETRYTLSGVLMVCDSKEMTMVATDGHRLAHTRRPVAFGKELRVIVPRKALEEVSRFAADSEERLWTWRHCRTIWCSGRVAPRW